MEKIRLNKYLGEAGVCSRRQADQLIAEGRVTVDGQVASTGMKVSGEEEILVDGQSVTRQQRRLLLVLNKPRGVVCTSDRRWGDTLVEDLIDLPERVYSIGRLDKDSEGLLLMTNQGDLLNKIMKAGNRHEKEYIVEVDHPVTPAFLKKLASGVYLKDLGRMTRPCMVKRLGEKTFQIVLTQGLNRQIRRMCQTFDYEVVSLKRVRIMNIVLGDLQPGTYRPVSDEEWGQLQEMLKGSVDNTELRYTGRRRSDDKKRV